MILFEIVKFILALILVHAKNNHTSHINIFNKQKPRDNILPIPTNMKWNDSHSHKLIIITVSYEY